MTRQIQVFDCPCCGGPLFQIHTHDGCRTDDSEPLKEDEHGKYSVCPKCKNKIRMVQDLQGVWTLAQQQDCT